MKKIIVLVFVCLVVSIAFANNAMIKTFFKQDDVAVGRPKSPLPLFDECVPYVSEFLRCPKSRQLIAAQSGRQKLFYTNSPPPNIDDRYIYVVQSGNCYRIVREIAVGENAFYGAEVCR